VTSWTSTFGWRRLPRRWTPSGARRWSATARRCGCSSRWRTPRIGHQPHPGADAAAPVPGPAPRAERSARGRSDRCRPRPRGVVEALVGYAGADLLVPGVAGWVGLAAANQAVVAWCAEVNARCAQRPAPRQPSGWRRSGRCCDHCLACGRRCAVARPARSIGWRPYASARPATSYWSTIPSIFVARVETFVDRGTETMTDQAGK
jgi:hypothetical protein